MSVYSSDSGKSLEDFEEFMKQISKNLREGRRCGAIRFYVAGDYNIELGLLCAGDERTRSSRSFVDLFAGTYSMRILVVSKDL